MVRDQFLSFDSDMKAMTLLDSSSQYFADEEQLEILRVLGAYGLTLEDRFELEELRQVKEESLILQRRHAKWVAKCEQCVGVRQQILGQVIARFEEAINAQYSRDSFHRD